MLPRFLLGTLLCLLASSRALAAPAWAQTASDAPADPATRFGVLDNGLRYAVRANAEPRGRVAFRLLVLAGSLHEREDERGLAHFVEHMAFAGSTHFPPGTLVNVLQRHGFAFGADVSAFTFNTHTIYQLDAPADESARLAEALSVLRDFADGVSFLPAEVERERGVVQSERRARDNWQSRALDARMAFLHPDSLVAARNPIGDEAIIERATADQLRTFYHTWYRADNLIVIAVGDASLDALEALVREHFASLATPAAPLPVTPDPGAAANPARLEARLHESREAGALSLELCSVQPGRHHVETRADRAASVRAELVMTMLNERMSQARRAHAQQFGSASAASFHADPLYTESSLRIDAGVADARAALFTLGQEWRRAALDGFSDDEIADTVALVRRRFEYALTATPVSRELADELAFSVVQNRVFSSWTQRWQDVQPVLDNFTPAEARAAFATLWPDAPRLFVVGPLSLPNAEAALAEAFAAGARAGHSVAVSGVLRRLNYPVADRPGAIRSRKYIADVDLHTIEFANGIRLNLKRTEFRQNLVYVRARIGWGLLTQPHLLPGLGLIAAAYVNEAGVGQHSGEDLRRFLNARNSALVFSAEEDAFTLNGSSDSAGVMDLLTLTSAYLHDLAWRPADFTAAQRQIGSLYSNSMHDPSATMTATAARVIGDDDSRFALPPLQDTLERTFKQLLDWLGPALNEDPVEIGIVGDIDVERVIDHAARTLGVLPSRPVRERLRVYAFPPIRFSTKPGRWQTYADTAIPRAVVRLQWPVRGCRDIHRRRKLEILGAVVEDLVRREIREKRGATYDPSAEVWNGSTDRDDGYLIVTLTTDPADATAISQDLAQLGQRLAEHGATEEEFQAALQPRLTENATRLRDNSYWLYYVVSLAQERPDHLDWPGSREADYRTMTCADVNALAREFLGKKAQLFVALPKDAPTATH